MKNDTENLDIEYDVNWKWLIEKYPRQFILFFLPIIYPEIDFSYQPRFAKQEFAKLGGAKNKKGNIVADLVLEVKLTNGEKRYLFIHIEVQSGDEENFGWKMFKPFYWLKDKYGKEITALAIFVGERLPKNPNKYEYIFGETKVSYTYPIYVVKDAKDEELRASDNLFAVAVLACKHLLKTKPDKFSDRLQLRLDLIDYILEKYHHHNFDLETAESIANFVVNLLILPKQEELKFESICTEKYKIEPAMREFLPEHYALVENRNKIMFGTTIEELRASVLKDRLLREAEKEKVMAEKKEVMAEKKEVMAEKKEVEEIRRRTIWKCHEGLKMTPLQIAKFLELEEKYVKSAIARYKRKLGTPEKPKS